MTLADGNPDPGFGQEQNFERFYKHQQENELKNVLSLTVMI